MGAGWSHIRSDIAHYLDLFEEALHLRPAAASPVGFSLLPGLGSLGIVNQFGTAMCTCASSDLYVSWLLRHAGQLPPAGGFSWPALYGYTERKYNVDHEGLEPVQVLDVLQSWGIPPWTADPLTTPTETWQQAEAALTPALDAEAARYRISGYGSVPVDLRDIAAAVRIPRPVFLVGAVYPSFESLVPMALQNPPAELVAALGGQGASILGVRPGSWLNQQVVGIHQWLAVGTLPRSFLPDPISEGTGDYAICATTWGGWASGPASLFLVPETYLQAAVSEAWLIHGMQGLAASPRCVALTRQIAQLRAFLRDYPNIPESNKLAISNAIAAAQQTMAQSGCPA